MTILDIEINRFGRFQNKKIAFTQGLNVIYGKNETGKSTIHSFIRCMLLGMKPGEDGTPNPNYELYMPWDGGREQYGGKLRFASQGNIYRIERIFTKSDESLHLIDESTGEELNPPRERLKALLEGMTETSYDNTVSIAQLKSATEPQLVAELERFASNASQTKNVRIDMGKARERLQKQADGIRQAYTENAEEDLESVTAELKKAREEKARLEDWLYRSRRERDQLEDRLNKETRDNEEMQLAYERERENRLHQYEAARRNWENAPDPSLRRRNIFTPLFFLMGILCLAGVWFLWKNTPVFDSTMLYLLVGLGVGAVICLVAGFTSIAMDVRTKKRYAAEDELREKLKTQLQESVVRFETFKDERPESGEAAAKQMRADLSEKDAALEQCDKDLKKSCATCENLAESVEELRSRVERNRSSAKELEAVEMAMQTLSTVAVRAQETFGNRLSQEAASVLASVTNGRYDRLTISAKDEIIIGTDVRMIPLRSLSVGTAEQVYFAIRVAAASLLWQKSPLPFIFDDVFSRYDDERLTSAIAILKDCGHQVIIFSCTSREDQIVSE